MRETVPGITAEGRNWFPVLLPFIDTVDGGVVGEEQGQFKLVDGYQKGFLNNLDRTRRYLRLYQFWLKHADKDRMKRLDAAARDFANWGEKRKATLAAQNWTKPKPYVDVPLFYKVYVAWLDAKRSGKQRQTGDLSQNLFSLSVSVDGGTSAKDARRMISRDISRARKIAEFAAKGKGLKRVRDHHSGAAWFAGLRLWTEPAPVMLRVRWQRTERRIEGVYLQHGQRSPWQQHLRLRRTRTAGFERVCGLEPPWQGETAPNHISYRQPGKIGFQRSPTLIRGEGVGSPKQCLHLVLDIHIAEHLLSEFLRLGMDLGV